jgi:rhodanese-related sulfurtransferase
VKFIVDNWMLVALALVSGGLLFMPVMQGMAARGISAAQAVQLMNREKAVVVDVSDAEEFAAAHIAGSKNIPLGELEAKLAGTVKNKNVPLILVCRSGARSLGAAAKAGKLGFAQPHSLAGGISGWREAALPLESASAG